MLFTGDLKKQLVDLLDERSVKFYHACQLQDFSSYLKIGGIPSREYIEQTGLPFTPFQTDVKDRVNGVWPKVFGNLHDIGKFFAQGRAPYTPTVYGPILCVFNPQVLLEADDVAVCLRSAGGPDFNRVDESLNSIEEVDKLFLVKRSWKRDNPYFAEESLQDVLPSKELKLHFSDQRFRRDGTLTPEISCSVENGLLSFEHLNSLTVDSVLVSRQMLRGNVETLWSNVLRDRTIGWAERFREPVGGGFTEVLPVNARKYPSTDQEKVSIELSKVLGAKKVETLAELISMDVSDKTKTWAKMLMSSNLDYQWNRFAKYLTVGTLAKEQIWEDFEKPINSRSDKTINWRE
jgi:hypothetical protein